MAGQHFVVPDICFPKHPEPRSAVQKVPYTAVYRRWLKAIGSWFHATLAAELRARGFALEIAEEHALFRLKGVPVSVCTFYSGRTQGAILPVDHLPPFDRSSSVSEQSYRTLQPEALKALWTRALSELGIQLAVSRIKPVEPCPAATDEFYQDVANDAGRMSAFLREEDVLRALCQQLVLKKMGAPNVRLLQQCLAALEPIEPSAFYRFPQWTTKENADDEHALGALAERLSGRSLPLARIHREELMVCSEEQRSALRTITSAMGGIAILEGPPGTGKSSILAPLINAHRQAFASGCVIGVAESWQAALSLKALCGIDTCARAALMEKYKPGRQIVAANSLIVLDEAGLLSTRHMLELLQLVDRHRLRLVAVGDVQQLQPIGAGCGLTVLKASLPAARLGKVIRQAGEYQELVGHLVALSEANDVRITVDDVKKAVYGFADGCLEQALWRAFGTSSDAVAAVIEDSGILQLVTSKSPHLPLILVRGHREADHVTRVVRGEMRACDALSGPDHVVYAATPMGWSHRVSLAVGDYVRITTRCAEQNLVNGSEGRITNIIAAGSDLTLELALTRDPSTGVTGRTVSIPMRKLLDVAGRALIAPAYASTIYAAQGRTVHRAFLLKATAMSFREFYVAMTRAREKCQVYETNAGRARLQDTLASFKQSIARDIFRMRRGDKVKSLALPVGALTSCEKGGLSRIA